MSTHSRHYTVVQYTNSYSTLTNFVATFLLNIAKHLFSIYCAPLKLLISTLTPFLIQKHFFFFLTVCLTTVYYCILINLPPNKIVLQLCTVLYNHQFLRYTVTCICFLMQKAKPHSLHAALILYQSD